MTTTIVTKGMEELLNRMRAYPGKLNAAIKLTMDASLLVLWESVPPYPAQPANSGYDRTGTLGRSLGSSQGGGTGGGEPDIYAVTELGAGDFEGHFGTKLEYSPRVIGDSTQEYPWAGYWWNMSTISERAKPKITALWNTLGDKLKGFLERG